MSKFDRNRIKDVWEKLHKQTDRQTDKPRDTTKIMVTWPWTNSGKAIHDDMLATLGDNAPCIQYSEKLASRVETWEKQCRGWASFRMPKDAASTENVQIVNDMLKEDRRLTIRHIAETTDIYATTVYRIYQVILVWRGYQHIGCLEC